MEDIPITSKAIKAVKHCKDRHCLHVTFHTGQTYEIQDCTDRDVWECRSAQSVGRHINGLMAKRKSVKL